MGSIALGYARQLGTLRRIGIWLGARGHLDIVPEELRLFYGTRTPAGLAVSLRLRAPSVSMQME